MDRLNLVDEQGLFYRNNFRRLLKFVYVLIFFSAALLGIILYQLFTTPTPQYFVTTSDGRLIEIKPVQE